jgi:Mrp family chromosome partitioning ATPase
MLSKTTIILSVALALGSASAAFAADVPEWLDPGTSQSKAVLVGSQAVLRGVVKQLKLDEKWSSRGGMPLTMDEALTQISRSVYVRPARERDILMIEASDANPALAIQIANAVFDEFQTQSVAGLRQQSDEALGRLREESVRQYRTMCDAQDLVLAARMRLDQTSVESALPQSMPRGTATATATALRERLDRIRAEIDDGRARLAVLRAMEAQGAAANANGLLHDEQANKLLDQTREVEQELSALSDRCGPNHPAVVKQALALNALRKQLGDRVSSCANGLEIELAARTQHLRAMEQQMMGGSDPSMRASTAGGPVAQLTQAYDNAVLEADLQTKVYQSLRDRLQRTSIEAQLPRPAAQAIERPIQATLDTSRRLCDMPMIAVGLTLLFAAIAARIADSLDVGVRSGAAAGSILAAPLLATLRQRPRMLDDQHVTVEEIEAFRMVVARMRFLDPESRMRTLAVVRGGRGEGRSSTVANLACLFAAQGQRVLVVDTDLNSASMHERFDVTPVPGLVDFLENSAALDDVIAPSNMSNVWLTPAGTPGAKTSPTPLHIAALTRQAQSRFDMVIYDTAPLSEASDAAIVAREAQHALFVVRAGRSTQPARSPSMSTRP